MTGLVSAQNAEHYVWGGACDGWHLLQSPGLSVIQERVPPGAAEVRHLHNRSHQFFYVLSGWAAMEVDTQRLEIPPGHGCSIPPGVPHRLSNESGEDVVFLVISAPMSHGDRVVVE